LSFGQLTFEIGHARFEFSRAAIQSIAVRTIVSFGLCHGGKTLINCRRITKISSKSVNRYDGRSKPNVGRYQVPRLEIRAFGKWVGIIPKARKTIKTARPPQSGAPERATGRVDITDEIRRYVLYRIPAEGGESWFIEGPSLDPGQPLTQEHFEEALMSYFQ